MFDIVLSSDAQDFYLGADPALAKRLNRCFSALETDPRRHNNAKQLKGGLSGKWRFRVGDWRVLYAIDDARQRVNILTIAHRREIYE